MELSERLLMSALLVERGSVAADVGCDHGFTSIWLVQRGICPRVLAMDVNPGPLERAGEHIREAGLSAYIETPSFRRAFRHEMPGRETGGGTPFSWRGSEEGLPAGS